MSQKRIRVTVGGKTLRERAIAEAHAWMREHASANTPTPGREYLLVRDLLAVALRIDR